MISWEDRRDEMFACLVEQGYDIRYDDCIGIEIAHVIMVYDILYDEGYRDQYV